MKRYVSLLVVLMAMWLAFGNVFAEKYMYKSSAANTFWTYTPAAMGLGGPHVPVHWADSAVPVTWRLNSSGAGDGLSYSQTQSAVQEAFDEWQSVPTASISFNYGGSTSTNTWANNGENVLYWAEAGDPAHNPGGPLGDANAVAVTICSINDSGELLDVDIVFDGRDRTWKEDGNDYDIQGVSTHEVGHMLGLAHTEVTSDPKPTMYSGYIGTQARDLEFDDKVGVSYLYRGNLIDNETFSDYKYFWWSLTQCSGKTLTLNPGMFMRFAPDTKLTIKGKLTAQGTSSNPVYFTSGYGDEVGRWQGVEFISTADPSSVMEYCQIQNAVYAIYCDDADPDLQHNTITYSSVGIKGVHMMNSGSISHNTIHNTVTAVALYSGSTVPVTYNDLSSNSRSLHADGSSPTVQHNTMNNNNNDGMWLHNSADIVMGDNEITGNTCWGMWLWDQSDPVLQGSGDHNNIHDNGNSEIYCQYKCKPLLGNSALGLPGHNDIYDDTGYAIFILHTQSYYNLTAEYNYWGTPDPDPNDLFWPHDAVDYQPYDSQKNFKLVTLAKEEAGERLRLGMDLEEVGDYQGAIAAYRSLLFDYPESQWARAAISSLYRSHLAAGERFLELHTFLAGLAESSRDSEVQSKAEELARHALVEAGEYVRAIAEYQHIADGGGEAALLAMVKMGEISLHRLKDREKSKGILEEVVRRVPEDSPEALAARILSDEVEAMPGPGGKEPEPSIFENPSTPERVQLSANYPNPFNPQTALSFALPEAMRVRLVVYNMLGQEVRVLFEGIQPQGSHTVLWDGRNAQGSIVGSGLYFARMEAGGVVHTRKLLLIR